MMFKVSVLWVHGYPYRPYMGLGHKWVWVSKNHMGRTDPMGDPNMGMGPIYGYAYGP
jgi:hypothetical protein